MPEKPDDGTAEKVPAGGTTPRDNDLVLLRALRDLAAQQKRDRSKQTALILFVVSSFFIVRQVLPPAWMVWLPL